jgi:hypothetical protein
LREVIIIVHTIGRVAIEREVTLRSSDSPDGITNPFVRSMRKLEFGEGLDFEGEAMDPTPIGSINIEISTSRHYVRERCIDLDLRAGVFHG